MVKSSEGWETTVPVQANQRYLLGAASRSAMTAGNGNGGFTLRLDWRDTNGRLLGTSLSRVPASASGFHRFSLAATAPPGTVTATVLLLATDDTTIFIDDVSLQEATAGIDLEAIP